MVVSCCAQLETCYRGKALPYRIVVVLFGWSALYVLGDVISYSKPFRDDSLRSATAMGMLYSLTVDYPRFYNNPP